MTPTQFHFYWRDHSAARRFRTAVSLHSHTLHSKESLDFVPRIVRTVPLLRDAVASLERGYERKHRRRIDYAGAYWTPPLPERAALRTERRQIEETLGLNALVSLTDHDNIDAVAHLHLFEESQSAPVSLEWTVPYGPSFFHLGVHNLPRDASREWMSALAEYTRRPAAERLRELLAALHEIREVLVVLNHPLWDEKGIGAENHWWLLEQFLNAHEAWLHAVEVNGMRPWAENRRVIELARALGYCVLSGGDRHGSDPNTTLNLTNTRTFEEFAEEIRRDRMSDVLIMPQYREPFRLRFAEAIWDIVREYPEQAGRVRWTERAFYRTADGTDAPLASVWAGDGPGVVGVFLKIMRVMSSRRVRSTLRFALQADEEVAL
jgi:hypothetical protein